MTRRAHGYPPPNVLLGLVVGGGTGHGRISPAGQKKEGSFTMPLKWCALLVAAVATTACLTANLVAGLTHGRLPILLNLLTLGTTAVAVTVAVVAERFDRLTGRVNQLAEVLVNRLDELDARTGDRNTGFVEGYLLRNGPEAAVVPLNARGGPRRASVGADD